MSHLLDRLQFFKKKQGEFADGHGETSNESRAWEGAYRQRWQHDKIVRSTHGVNCTGSCSWKIYVKNGLMRESEINQKGKARKLWDIEEGKGI